MHAVTWAPGTNIEHDRLFNNLREQQYQRKTHRLWQNYSERMIADCIACTICFGANGEPEMCSSIAVKSCWPNGAYRILNRLWKHSNKIPYPRVMSPSFAESARSQIEWLREHTDCKLFFISRQTDNWEQWVIENFRDVYSIHFSTDGYKYLTCSDQCDDACWQKIIFNGSKELLQQWKRRQ